MKTLNIRLYAEFVAMLYGARLPREERSNILLQIREYGNSYIPWMPNSAKFINLLKVGGWLRDQYTSQ